MKTKLFSLLLCLLASCSATTVEPVTVPEPAQVIVEKQPEIIWISPSKVRIPDDKIVMVFVGTETCHWCTALKENFKDPEVVKLVNEIFYPIYIDAVKDSELAKIFAPSMEVPTLVFFTIDDIFFLPGHPASIDTISSVGYISKEEIMTRLLQVIDIISSKQNAEDPSLSQP